MSKYLRIAEDLRDRIIAGAYGSGRRLPSNRELAATYDTSLATLRAALRLLDEQGWVLVEHGNGTFVADRGQDSDLLASLAEQTVGGDRLETRVLMVDDAVYEPRIARLLGRPEDHPLVRLDRLRLLEARPAVFQSSYLGEEHAPLLRAYDGRQPLYRSLWVEAGQAPSYSRERITAVGLPEHVAPTLGAGAGDAALHARRISSIHDGRPVVVDDAYVLTDVLELAIDRHGRSTSARFELVSERPAATASNGRASVPGGQMVGS